MNVIRPTLSAINFALIVFFFISLSFNSVLHAEEIVITDIILINGLAELVDINPDGEILQRHLTIPDYFSSGRSHKRTLKESLAKTQVYGISSEVREIEEIVFNAPVECRQSLMRNSKIENAETYNICSVTYARVTSMLERIETEMSEGLISSTAFFNFVANRIPIRRQRRLMVDRFEYVSSLFKPTNRTSRAIIDV